MLSAAFCVVCAGYSRVCDACKGGGQVSDVERLQAAMSGVSGIAGEERLRTIIREELQRVLHPAGTGDAREFVGVQVTTAEGHIYRGAAYLVELTDSPEDVNE